MKDLLINVLFIFFVLTIVQYFLEIRKRRLTRKVVSLYYFVASIIAIFFCMSFPFSLSEGFNVDFRFVPFIIGSMYGGPLVSLGLYLFIILYRLFLGAGFDLGFFGAILNYGIIPIASLMFYKQSLRYSAKKKLLLMIGITFFHIIISRLIYTFIFFSNLPLNIFLQSSTIKLVLVIVVFLAIERMNFNYQLRRKMIDIEKNETISHLSAAISHEVRNGLTGAKGFLQLLKESEKDNQKLRYIQIAEDELNRTEEIIRDFLTFAKPSHEKYEHINMEELIEKTIDLITPHANMNSIEINKQLIPYTVIGGRRVLQQSLLNIFKNAIEAMPAGGTLTIRMEQDKRNGYFTINISDTGIGMNKEQIERLGKPYFTTKGQHGTGLGLMVAFRVVEDLNGRIEITSELNRGTTVSVFFPLVNEGETVYNKN